MARRCGAKHICKSKCGKHHGGRSHFGRYDVQKLHAAVARSIFVSQNVENTTGAEPFWKLRCSQIARGCGAKHICKSKCTKHHMGGAILDVSMFKNGTRLWRKAHLQVKMHKTPQGRSHFGSCDVQKLHAAVAKSTFASENAKKTDGFGPLFEVHMSKNGTPLWREAHLQGKMR